MLLYQFTGFNNRLHQIAAETVANIVQVRGIPKDQVTLLARLNRAYFVRHIDGGSTIEGDSGQHLLRGQPLIRIFFVYSRSIKFSNFPSKRRIE